MPLRPIIATIAACAIVAFLTWPVHGGFIVLFTLPVLAFWFPYSCYVIWRHPARRRLQTIKLCLWLIVVGGVCGLHLYYCVSARSAANDVINAVLTYKEQHGSYPPRLEVAGIALGKTGGPWRIGYVIDEKDTHALVYPTTFTVFEAYIYEFEQGRWVYVPD
jgi:hypothetical protein